MTGIVLKSTGSRYLVKSGKQVFDCVLRGKVRLDLRKSTNPVAVGDQVDIEVDDKGEAGIAFIHPRKNYIIRKSIKLSRQVQVLAANIDQAFVIVTPIQPRTSPGFSVVSNGA